MCHGTRGWGPLRTRAGTPGKSPGGAPGKAAALDADYGYVHSEPQGAGVTQKPLWEEYRGEAGARGSAAVSCASFCRGCKRRVTGRNVTNHLGRKPGQAMGADRSGPTVKLASGATGEVGKARPFVAAPPYSRHACVEATADMKQNARPPCHAHAHEIFDGVAVRCVCDDLKTVVAKHPREGEVVPNEAYESLGRHHMCAVMPTGARRPRQKPSAEGSAGDIAAAIARPRDQAFSTPHEPNAAIAQEVADYNGAPLQKSEGSRRIVFGEVESAFLVPPPEVQFEVCDWVCGRAADLDLRVVSDKNRYSVPFRRVGAKADLRVTANAVEAYVGGSRVASYPRPPSFVQYRCQTDPARMPPRFVSPEWDEGRILGWAREIGPATLEVVARAFGAVRVPERAGNPSPAILNLTQAIRGGGTGDACSHALSKSESSRRKLIRTVPAGDAASGHDAGDEPSPGGHIRGEGCCDNSKGARKRWMRRRSAEPVSSGLPGWPGSSEASAMTRHTPRPPSMGKRGWPSITRMRRRAESGSSRR